MRSAGAIALLVPAEIFQERRADERLDHHQG
jgi:hypothetical protein